MFFLLRETRNADFSLEKWDPPIAKYLVTLDTWTVAFTADWDTRLIIHSLYSNMVNEVCFYSTDV